MSISANKVKGIRCAPVHDTFSAKATREASVQFTKSIICAIQVCKQSFMSRSNPARKAALVQTKFTPAVILELAMFSQTLYASYFFVQNFIRLPF